MKFKNPAVGSCASTYCEERYQIKSITFFCEEDGLKAATTLSIFSVFLEPTMTEKSKLMSSIRFLELNIDQIHPR